MIHVRASGSDRDIEDSILQFSLVSLDTVKKFQELLNRSLNCSPEFGREWFELADKVEAFIKKEEAAAGL